MRFVAMYGLMLASAVSFATASVIPTKGTMLNSRDAPARGIAAFLPSLQTRQESSGTFAVAPRFAGIITPNATSLLNASSVASTQNQPCTEPSLTCLPAALSGDFKVDPAESDKSAIEPTQHHPNKTSSDNHKKTGASSHPKAGGVANSST